MDKMREEFEAWALSQKWCVDCVDMAGGVYINTYVGCAYQAWQASRKALVVELPKAGDDNWGCLPYERGMIDGMNAMREDCMTALDAAGVAYK